MGGGRNVSTRGPERAGGRSPFLRDRRPYRAGRVRPAHHRHHVRAQVRCVRGRRAGARHDRRAAPFRASGDRRRRPGSRGVPGAAVGDLSLTRADHLPHGRRRRRPARMCRVGERRHTAIDIFNGKGREEYFREGGVSALTLLPTDQIVLARVLADRKACFLHSCGGHRRRPRPAVRRPLRSRQVHHDDHARRPRARLCATTATSCGSGTTGSACTAAGATARCPSSARRRRRCGAVLFLRQDHDQPYRAALRGRGDPAHLLPCVIKPLVTADWWESTLDVVEHIIKDVPCYVVEFDKSGAVVTLLRDLVAAQVAGERPASAGAETRERRPRKRGCRGADRQPGCGLQAVRRSRRARDRRAAHHRAHRNRDRRPRGRALCAERHGARRLGQARRLAQRERRSSTSSRRSMRRLPRRSTRTSSGSSRSCSSAGWWSLSEGPDPTPYAVDGGVQSLSGEALSALLGDVLARGVPFRFEARGYSMLPFIHDGDVVTISPLRGRRARWGEVVAFAGPARGPIVHRVVARRAGRYAIQADNLARPGRRRAGNRRSRRGHAGRTPRPARAPWPGPRTRSRGGSRAPGATASRSWPFCAPRERASTGRASSHDLVRGQHAAARIRPLEPTRGQEHPRVLRSRADGALQQRLPALLHQPAGRRPRREGRRADPRRDRRRGRPGRRARRAVVLSSAAASPCCARISPRSTSPSRSAACWSPSLPTPAWSGPSTSSCFAGTLRATSRSRSTAPHARPTRRVTRTPGSFDAFLRGVAPARGGRGGGALQGHGPALERPRAGRHGRVRQGAHEGRLSLRSPPAPALRSRPGAQRRDLRGASDPGRDRRHRADPTRSGRPPCVASAAGRPHRRATDEPGVLFQCDVGQGFTLGPRRLVAAVLVAVAPRLRRRRASRAARGRLAASRVERARCAHERPRLPRDLRGLRSCRSLPLVPRPRLPRERVAHPLVDDFCAAAHARVRVFGEPAGEGDDAGRQKELVVHSDNKRRFT